MGMVKRDKVSDPTRWAAIREWFVKANHVDTENASRSSYFIRAIWLPVKRRPRVPIAAFFTPKC